MVRDYLPPPPPPGWLEDYRNVMHLLRFYWRERGKGEPDFCKCDVEELVHQLIEELRTYNRNPP